MQLQTQLIQQIRASHIAPNNSDDSICRIEPIVQHWVQSDHWLSPHHRICNQPEQAHLLYSDEDLMIAVFCWGIDGYSPIHNHLTWGVVGLIIGKEQSTHYVRCDENSRQGCAVLKEDQKNIMTPGNTLIMPEDCIHQVHNLHHDVSVSLHVYGKNLSQLKRSQFDLTTHTQTPYQLKLK